MIKNVDQIKNMSDIVEVIEHYMPVQKNGANFLSICPFHTEKTPSLSISQKKQLFYCFGCNKGGDVFKFVEMLEHCDFSEAVRKTAEICHVDVIETSESNQVKFDKSKIYSVFSVINDLAREELDKNNEAKEYLFSRKLNEEDFDRFLIGFLPSSKTIAERLMKLGLLPFAEQANLIKNGYCNLENRISFAISKNNKIVAFSARTLSSDKTVAKYINSATSIIFEKKQTIYGLDNAKRSKNNQILLVEGIMDVIAANKLGFDAIATCGTALSTPHLSILSKLGKDIIVAYDNDTAGFNATSRALEMFFQHCFYNVYAIKRKTGLKDFGEHLQNGVKADFDIVNGFEYMIRRQIYLCKNINEVQNAKNRFAKILDNISEYASEYKKLFTSCFTSAFNVSFKAEMNKTSESSNDILLEFQKYLINIFADDESKKEHFFKSKYFEFLNLPLLKQPEIWNKIILDPKIREVEFYADEFNGILKHLIRQGCQNALLIASRERNCQEILRVQKILKDIK